MTLVVTALSLRRLKTMRAPGGLNNALWFNDENMDGAHASIIMEIPAPRNSKRRINSPADVEVPWRRMVSIYCGYTRAIVLGLEDVQYRRCVRRPADNALVGCPVCLHVMRPPARLPAAATQGSVGNGAWRSHIFSCRDQ